MRVEEQSILILASIAFRPIFQFSGLPSNDLFIYILCVSARLVIDFILFGNIIPINIFLITGEPS